MRGILAKLLTKRGINNIDDLSHEEKQTFENYERVLSKEQLTVEDITKFLETQVSIIEARWRDYATENKATLIPYHTVYKTLLEAIKSPQKERENLEAYLNQQL